MLGRGDGNRPQSAGTDGSIYTACLEGDRDARIDPGQNHANKTQSTGSGMLKDLKLNGAIMIRSVIDATSR